MEDRKKKKRQKLNVKIQWEAEGEIFRRRDPKWEVGSIVYLKWSRKAQPSKRILLGVGKVLPRHGFVGALWRLDQHKPYDDKDQQVMVIQLPYLVCESCLGL